MRLMLSSGLSQGVGRLLRLSNRMYRQGWPKPERPPIFSGFRHFRRYMRRGVIDPPTRIIDPKLEPGTQRQLRTIPRTGTAACLDVVRKLGLALLPATVMVLLHEANSLGDGTLADELEQRLLGRGTVDGEYENGVANPIIEGYARRYGTAPRTRSMTSARSATGG
jgi:hypothetical protein